MPCYTTRTITLDLAMVAKHKKGLDVLTAAFEAEGYVVRRDGAGIVARRSGGYPWGATLRYANGRLTVVAAQRSSAIVGEIKRQFTKQAFRMAAKQRGFQVKENRKGQLVAERRSYAR